MDISKEEFIEFLQNDNNRDFIEQSYLYSIKSYGWNTLTSGKVVYISEPIVSGEEVGIALKNMLKIMEDSKINV